MALTRTQKAALNRVAQAFGQKAPTAAQTRAAEGVGRAFSGGGGSTTPAPAPAPAPSTVRFAIAAGNGQTVYFDQSGQVFSAPTGGVRITNEQLAAARAGTGPIPGTEQIEEMKVPPNPSKQPAELSTAQIAALQASYDAAMARILANPLLTVSQKAHLTEIGGVLATGDKAKFTQMVTAFENASKYSEPFFKAQIALSLDTLKQGFLSQEGDLTFKETQTKKALEDLRANTRAAKDQLSFQHAQELKKLEESYTQDLQATQDALAATGFTSSSKRARSEDILAQQNQGLVESATKTFGYQTGNLERSLTSSEADTQARIQELQRLAAEGKLNLLRQTETKVGSRALADLGYTGLLGNVGGEIPYNQFKDAAAAANATLGSNQPYSFVF